MVRCRTVGALVGVASLAILASGCVVRAYSTPATATVYTSGSVHTSGEVGVDEGETYTVNNYPPEPLYEEVTVSPGYGHVWLDGHWNWNGYDWTWSSGRWVRERPGYIYVAPYYDHVSGRYVYRSGYWSRRDRLPRSVVVRESRDGRPPVYVRDVRDHRAARYREPYIRDRPYRGPDVRDHRTPGYDRQPGYDRRGPDVRDHRTPGYDRQPGYDRRGPDVRDHRTPGYDRQPDTRDHRAPGYDRRQPASRQPASRPPPSDHRQPRKDRDKDEDDGNYKRRPHR